MAELFLVRHAQASFGSCDYDRLSAAGLRQSRRLGSYFASRQLRFDYVFSGAMRRHLQTVAGIMAGMAAEQACVELPGLSEFDFAALYAAASAQWPELGEMSRGGQKEFFAGLKRVLLLWTEGKIEAPVPERWDEFQQRVAEASRFIQQTTTGRVLVVTSGGVIGALTQQILGANAAAAIELNLQIFNSSLSRYFFNAERIALASFNYLPHLDANVDQDLVTYG